MKSERWADHAYNGQTTLGDAESTNETDRGCRLNARRGSWTLQ